MAHKKYTQEVFDAIEDPAKREYFLSVTPLFDVFAVISKLRKEKGLTQQELAEKAQIPQPTLARIEAGRANPTLDLLLKICEPLECTIQIQPKPTRGKSGHDIL